MNRSRRDFLVRCCQGVSAAWLPLGFRYPIPLNAAALPPSSHPEYHLHPRYRAQLPLEATLLKVDPSLDRFPTERYCERIESVLAEWSARLRRSPQDVHAIETSLDSRFSGTSCTPANSRVVRKDSWLEIRRNQFSGSAALGRDAFLRELRSALDGFTEILTAEFQVTGITASSEDPPASLQTRVRYELVGSGRDSYREQRVGEWDLEWLAGPDQHFLLRSWKTRSETLIRAPAPVYLDLTASAFSSNASYSQQMLHGSDYWRTVLDQVSGIDIYGHNGVAVADIDGDGFDELYVCQPAGLPNRLYRNRGDGTFEDISEKSGVDILENTACALFADFDNDGRQDLVIVRTDGPVLYTNEANGRFRKRSDAFQFAKPPQGTFTGAAVADYDCDGWLDIYFCLYLYYQGSEQYKYPLPYHDANNGPPNFLMRNQRDGTFRDVTEAAGLNVNNTRYSFCCAWNDYDGDGWPDLCVVNDFGRKNLYHNNGDGTFTDVAAKLAVDDVGAGMGVSWVDYDNDGITDLYVANMWTAAGERISSQPVFLPNAPADVRALYHKHSMGNSLFRNRKSEAFENAGAKAGVEMGRWSWSSDAWDFDHDGFSDLYVANGMISGPSRADLNSFFWRQVVANSPLRANPSPEYEQGWSALNELIRTDGTWSGYERNVFYANNRDGTFSDVSAIVGLDFVEDSRSFALSDFDHDGRLEVILKNRNSPQLRYLKNVIKQIHPSIAFRLRGTRSNRDAIGAVITIKTPSGTQTRSLQAGSGFLSQHTKEVFFGLGETSGPMSASIRWPGGLVQELHDLPANHRIWVEEGQNKVRTEPFAEDRVAAPVNGIQPGDNLPDNFETWLLAPVKAPDFSLPDKDGKMHSPSSLRGEPLLLYFWVSTSEVCRRDLEALDRYNRKQSGRALQILCVNVDDSTNAADFSQLAKSLSLPSLHASNDIAGIYNVLYRYLFDRHRDLALPASFLLDESGDIVKIYIGATNFDRITQDSRQIPKTAEQRIAKALPFAGTTDTGDFQRNYLSLGSVFFQREYFEQAAEWFQLALKADPASAEPLYGLGSVFLKQQNRNDARDYFEKATKQRATYPETLPNAWNNLGLIATQEGNTVQAIPYFQQALKVNPDHLIALNNLASAYRQQKQWDEAREVLTHALTINPDDAEANYGLGMVFAQAGENDRAYEHLQKALQARPTYPEALNNLGVLYLRTGRRDDAVATFEKCIRVAPQFDQAYMNLARVYAIEGDRAKAGTVLRDLLKQRPDHAQAQKALEELGQ